MKRFLFVGIFLILGVSIIGPYVMSFQKQQETAEQVPSDNRMIHPRYMASDEKGQPYEVTAEIATQVTEKEPTSLKNPEGSLTLEEGQILTVKAKNGLYDAQGKFLNLDGDVILTTTDGYRVKTEKANVTLSSKTIQGGDPVEGSGPKGTLKGADGFEIRHQEGGDIITLKGRSQVVINKADGA
jgi:lipopolysaccharide export system protein LptC